MGEIGHCVYLEASVGALWLGLDKIVGAVRLLLVLAWLNGGGL